MIKRFGMRGMGACYVNPDLVVGLEVSAGCVVLHCVAEGQLFEQTIPCDDAKKLADKIGVEVVLAELARKDAMLGFDTRMKAQGRTSDGKSLADCKARGGP